METAKFTQMKDGDREDYQFLRAHEIEFARQTADRLLLALQALDQSLSGYKVSRLQHSLQAATRAFYDGADMDWMVAALLHDIGDIYAPYNHDEYAATVIRPFVREQCTWVVEVHADFQLFYYGHYIGANQHKREAHRHHPYFADCVEFCERWDQSSFDPEYKTLPLDFFAPMLRQVFARTEYAPDVILAGKRQPLLNPEQARQRKASHALCMSACLDRQNWQQLSLAPRKAHNNR